MKLAIGPCMAVLIIAFIIAAMVRQNLKPSPLKITEDEE
jgi:hypothetical protein